MRRVFLLYVCIGFLFLAHFWQLGALELEVSGGINNFSYDPEKTIAYTSTAGTSNDFQPYLFGFGTINFKDEIGRVLGYRINLERDVIMQNSLYAAFSARADYFFIELGPFVGMRDALEIPDFGLMGTIEATLPGVGFLSFGGSSSMGSSLDFTSDNIHESAEAKIGIWLAQIIILSFSAGTKSYAVVIEETASNLIRRDSLTRYQFSVDLFAKNSPFRLRLDGGYQTFSRDYERGNVKETDEVSAYFAGLEMSIQILQSLRETSRSCRIIAGCEMPILPSAKEPMTISAEFWNFYKAKAGFAFTFN